MLLCSLLLLSLRALRAPISVISVLPALLLVRLWTVNCQLSTVNCFSLSSPISCSPPATFFNSSRLSSATLLLSTLPQSPFPTPLQSTHAHLSHSRPLITPAIPTHTNLVSLNPFPCNTSAKNTCGRRADILECGGSPPLLRLTQERQMNGWGETDRIAKAGASSRTPKEAKMAT